MHGLETTSSTLEVFTLIVSELQVNPNICKNSFSSELFATDQVLKLTSSGISFRDAYKQVAKALQNISNLDPVENILSKKHQGATGNLGLEISRSKMEGYQQWADVESSKWAAIQKALLI